MKERPILFSAAMVRAILEDRKTQTRRIIKPQPNNPETFGVSPIWGRGVRRGSDKFGIHAATNVKGKRVDAWIDCPHGQPGDGLWVKETWGYRGSGWSNRRPDVAEYTIHYQADDARRVVTLPAKPEPSGLPHQHPPRRREDEDEFDYAMREDDYISRWWKAWRPSIHMPRWASRLTLEVESIRVERLQDISQEDAIAEGVERGGPSEGEWHRYTKDGPSCEGPLESFRSLWSLINGPESWDTNHWVWVLGFKRAEQKAVAHVP